MPVGNVEALARALTQLIQNRSLRAKMGIRGREIAVTEFSLQQVIDANLVVYNSLLSPAIACTDATAMSDFGSK